MGFNITGYSTALFSTWYFIEELGILFDAGEGVTSGLLQKSRKIKHILISHADRDHLTGLLQLNQLNAREGFPVVYYPEDCGSFPALEKFSKKFDTHVKGTLWKPITETSVIKIKNDILIESIRNNHIEAPDNMAKSLSYKVVKTKRKLKEEYKNLPGREIKKLIEEKGNEKVTKEIRTNVLGYSGDTPVEDYYRWDNTDILIHEATFLDENNQREVNSRGNKHSTLEEVIRMVSEINIQKLILGHFSSRYSAEQIDTHIRKLCDKYAINIPVYRLLPGEIKRDILNGVSINK
ncbi:MBL fold metallo-hydrolase [Aquimarina sp. MMG016]|uniref:MBL fold metallo-hydrolase n=1 Tax=Aquimarina sp. MMG016 TaxID=2822690 RepID=UPI001B3A40FD|nr:MBL fold metallo-hydrolase [Aquimarina sp. MMG016]MBQ4821993.1 RNAse Z [Aquimarina sp. MMG016]